MKKIIILIPVYNDWESFKKLILEINEIIKDLKEVLIDCFVINDASTINQPDLKKPQNIGSIKILNMKKNKGHARCNAFGIRYLIKKENFDFLILMDGDGEDRPIEIKSLINQILKNPNLSVVAKRVKRSEGPFFQFLYFMHKLITLILTGEKINFGNYSCLTRKDAETISSKANLWSSYSGTVKKNIKNFGYINSTRGNRYFGPSKMSFFKLLIHSLSIIAVFKFKVFFRSSIIIFLLIYLNKYLGVITLVTILGLLILNLIIFIVSFRAKKEELINSQENLNNIQTLEH